MKERHFKNYSIEFKQEDMLIAEKKKSQQVHLSSVVDFFPLKTVSWDNVKWYHRILVGVLYSGISIFIFWVTFVLSEHKDQMEQPSDILIYTSTTLWVLSGIFFLGMISLLLEMSPGLKGVTSMFSKRLFGKRNRTVVVRTAEKEYHLHVKNRREQNNLIGLLDQWRS